MLQVFQMDVAKGDRDSICSNGCTRMLQAFVPNVSSMFLDIYYKRVYLDVEYVSHICCKCFWMLLMFAMVFKRFSSVFFEVFQKHVLSVLSAFRHML
jgi:hypothetical protein